MIKIDLSEILSVDCHPVCYHLKTTYGEFVAYTMSVGYSIPRHADFPAELNVSFRLVRPVGPTTIEGELAKPEPRLLEAGDDL